VVTMNMSGATLMILAAVFILTEAAPVRHSATHVSDEIVDETPSTSLIDQPMVKNTEKNIAQAQDKLAAPSSPVPAPSTPAPAPVVAAVVPVVQPVPTVQQIPVVQPVPVVQQMPVVMPVSVPLSLPLRAPMTDRRAPMTDSHVKWTEAFIAMTEKNIARIVEADGAPPAPETQPVSNPPMNWMKGPAPAPLVAQMPYAVSQVPQAQEIVPLPSTYGQTEEAK